MPEDWKGSTGTSNKSAREFLEEFDYRLNSKQKFEKTYVRQTYLVRRDLNDRLNQLCKKRPGFKTQFINFMIKKGLEEIDTPEDESHVQENGDVPASQQSAGASGKELSPTEVEDMLTKELAARNLDELTQNKIRDEVLAGLFINGATQTSLGKSSLKGITYRHPLSGRGKTFSYVEKCVLDYIKQVVATLQHQNDKENSNKDKSDGIQINLDDDMFGSNVKAP